MLASLLGCMLPCLLACFLGRGCRVYVRWSVFRVVVHLLLTSKAQHAHDFCFGEGMGRIDEKGYDKHRQVYEGVLPKQISDKGKGAKEEQAKMRLPCIHPQLSASSLAAPSVVVVAGLPHSAPAGDRTSLVDLAPVIVRVSIPWR